jgi:hypothetical protein
MNYSSIHDDPSYHNFEPFNLKESFVCNVPTYIDTVKERIYQLRLFRQHGRLFASANNELTTALNERDFWKDLTMRIEIKPDAKVNIIEELKELGTTKESLILKENESSTAMINFINNEMKKF